MKPPPRKQLSCKLLVLSTYPFSWLGKTRRLLETYCWHLLAAPWLHTVLVKTHPYYKNTNELLHLRSQHWSTSGGLQFPLGKASLQWRFVHSNTMGQLLTTCSLPPRNARACLKQLCASMSAVSWFVKLLVASIADSSKTPCLRFKADVLLLLQVMLPSPFLLPWTISVNEDPNEKVKFKVTNLTWLKSTTLAMLALANYCIRLHGCSEALYTTTRNLRNLLTAIPLPCRMQWLPIHSMSNTHQDLQAHYLSVRPYPWHVFQDRNRSLA